MATPVVRVGFHRFSTYRRHPGGDGANLAYEEIVRLLSTREGFDLRPHDLLTLFADDDDARRALSGCDVVVATVGPHAYIYFYLRERLGLDFRIVRDVRTALWNGYLFQEALTARYVRAEDTVVHSTAFSRDLFDALVPGIPAASQHVCYPLTHWFPAPPPRRPARHTAGGSALVRPVTIGYVGRLTDDKNFSQALDLVATLERRAPGRFRLCAVGQGRAPLGSHEAARRLGPAVRAYEWVPVVQHGEIWRYYASFDLMFFPSTSNLETFGRVIVEAAHTGVPVLASDHGPSSELLDPTSLLPTRYHVDRVFTCHVPAALGTVDVDAAADRVLAGPPPRVGDGHTAYRDDAARFLRLVAMGNDVGGDARRWGTPRQRSFIRRVRMTGLDVPASAADSDRLIDKVRRRFVALHGRGPRYAWTLVDLLARSRHRRKTLEFARRSLLLGEDFTNIGGVDLQLSHVIGFYPTFQIAAADSPSVGDVSREGPYAQKVGTS